MPQPMGYRGPAARGDTRRATIVAALVVGTIAIALVKPWDALLPGVPPPSASPPSSAPSATAGIATVPTTTPYDADAQRPFALLPPPGGQDWSSVSWEALPRGHPVTTLRLVARSPAGYVAVGTGRTGSTPVWSSTDGASWNPLPFGMPDTLWPGATIVGGTSTPSGALLIAGLRSAPDCAASADCPFLPSLDAWASADALRWTPSHIDGFAPPSSQPTVLVAAIGSTAVLLGRPLGADGAPATRVASSVDGGPWTVLPDGTLPSDFVATDLAALRGRFVATGRRQDATGQSRAAVATSTDGRAWAVSLLPQALGATGDLPATALHIAAGPDGGLVTGSGAGEPAPELWWHSFDGAVWTSVDGFPPLGPRSCPASATACAPAADGRVVGDGTRIVAGGFIDDGPGVGIWSSADGVHWRRLAAPAGGPTGRLDWLTLLPEGVVVSVDGAPWYGAAASVHG